MANTVAVIADTGYQVTLEVTEDGNAAAATTTDLLADALAAGQAAGSPFQVTMGVAFATQAAARAAALSRLDVEIWAVSASGPVTPIIDWNVSGAAAGNVRLVTNTVKTANGDTAVYRIRLSLRHSIVD
jgi:hypothetical protein